MSTLVIINLGFIITLIFILLLAIRRLKLCSDKVLAQKYWQKCMDLRDLRNAREKLDLVEKGKMVEPYVTMGELKAQIKALQRKINRY